MFAFLQKRTVHIRKALQNQSIHFLPSKTFVQLTLKKPSQMVRRSDSRLLSSSRVPVLHLRSVHCYSCRHDTANCEIAETNMNYMLTPMPRRAHSHYKQTGEHSLRHARAFSCRQKPHRVPSDMCYASLILKKGVENLPFKTDILVELDFMFYSIVCFNFCLFVVFMLFDFDCEALCYWIL